MYLIEGAFVGEKNFDVIKMHGTTIKKINNETLRERKIWEFGISLCSSHRMSNFHAVEFNMFCMK